MTDETDSLATERAASGGATRGGDLPTRARVVIIGGGVIGTSVAYHLAKLGWNDVVLLERDQLTSGTTWHAAGLIVSGGMTTETLAWMAKYSRDLYEVLEAETGQSTGFRPVGYLQTASNPERLGKLRREADFMRLMGIEREEISAAEAAGLWPHVDPSDILAGFFTANEGRADPYNVAISLAAGARAGGVRIVQGAAVTGISPRRRPGDRCGDRSWVDRGRIRGQLRRDVGPPGRGDGRRVGAAAGDRARLSDQ